MTKFNTTTATEHGKQGGRVRSLKKNLDPFIDDPVAFMKELVDPETGEHFEPYPAQERFLEEALTLDNGRLRYPELVFSAPKKSGKTAFAAVILLYITRVVGGRRAQGFCLANDLDQSMGRVYAAAKAIVEASPILRGTEKAFKDRMEFKDGTTVTALASDYAGAAGANPSVSAFDELWGYTSERSTRLWDEMVPPPTRKVACRLTCTYAGFEGESELLEKLYKRGLKGKKIGPDLWADSGKILMFWAHTAPAPWQTEAWLEQMRDQLRPNAYLRMIENRFVSSESAFVDAEWWDACVNKNLRPIPRDPKLPVWIGLDASVKRDHTAIVAVTWDDDAKMVRLVKHWVFKPTPKDPLDFEHTIEATIREAQSLYRIREVRYDPYQLQASAQRLRKAHVKMEEFAQSQPNLTESSQNLYDLIKGRNLEVYPDKEMKLAINRAVAKETPRGWRITKEKTSHNIDVVVALAFACLAAVQQGSKVKEGWLLAPVEFVDLTQDSQWLMDDSDGGLKSDHNTTRSVELARINPYHNKR